MVLTERTSTVRKIAVQIPITDEQLDDVAQVGAYVNQRLSYMIRARLDSQIIAGNGTAPNLEGMNNVTGITTQAKGSHPTPDAVYKAIRACRATVFAEPSAVLVHPNDWQDIRLLTTTDGVYVFGPPSQAGVDTIWGKPVVVDSDITENTALVGAFQSHCYVAVRRGVAVQISSEHASYFIQGVKAVLAEMRAGLVVRREDAFTTVTGI